jgi:hypothetical protein
MSTDVGLKISKYTQVKSRDAPGKTGIVANFTLKKKKAGTIYQNITMTYKKDGNEREKTGTYCEAWTVEQRNVNFVMLIGGKDYFLIDRSSLKTEGYLNISAIAWFEAGVIDNKFTISSTDTSRGVLPGQKKHRTPGVNPIVRKVAGTWAANSQSIKWVEERDGNKVTLFE